MRSHSGRGNADEWEETDLDLMNDLVGVDHGVRGGYWINSRFQLRASNRFGNVSSNESFVTGFRVASIPEPSTIVLLGLGVLLLGRRIRR